MRFCLQAEFVLFVSPLVDNWEIQSTQRCPVTGNSCTRDWGSVVISTIAEAGQFLVLTRVYALWCHTLRIPSQWGDGIKKTLLAARICCGQRKLTLTGYWKYDNEVNFKDGIEEFSISILPWGLLEIRLKLMVPHPICTRTVPEKQRYQQVLESKEWLILRILNPLHIF